MEITKDMTVGQVLKEHPDTIPAFLQNGLMCLGCPGAQMETIEEAAMVHGLDLEKLLSALNAALEASEA